MIVMYSNIVKNSLLKLVDFCIIFLFAVSLTVSYRKELMNKWINVWLNDWMTINLIEIHETAVVVDILLVVFLARIKLLERNCRLMLFPGNAFDQSSFVGQVNDSSENKASMRIRDPDQFFFQHFSLSVDAESRRIWMNRFSQWRLWLPVNEAGTWKRCQRIYFLDQFRFQMFLFHIKLF